MKSIAARLSRGGLLWMVLVLAACGFHLRGNVALPQVMQDILVEGDRFSPLVRELGNVLRTSGARVVDSRKQASAVLVVLGETSSRRTLSVGSTGKVAEYEVHHSVDYQLEDAQGQVLVEKQHLAAKRDYQFDENDVLGKATEEENLREEMQRDLALRIVQQLSIIAR